MVKPYAKAPSPSGIRIARLSYRLQWEHHKPELCRPFLSGEDLMAFGQEGLYTMSPTMEEPILTGEKLWPLLTHDQGFAVDQHGMLVDAQRQPIRPIDVSLNDQMDPGDGQATRCGKDTVYLNGTQLSSYSNNAVRRWHLDVQPGTRLLGGQPARMTAFTWDPRGIRFIDSKTGMQGFLIENASEGRLTNWILGAEHVLVTIKGRSTNLFELHCVSIDMKQKWSALLPGSASGLNALTRDYLAVIHLDGAQQSILVYENRSARRLWLEAVHEDIIGIQAIGTRLYVLTGESNLHCMDAKTGSRLWVCPLAGCEAPSTWKPYGYGEVLIVPCGGVAVICAQTGTLVQMLETEGVAPDFLGITPKGTIYTQSLAGFRCYVLEGYLGEVAKLT